MSIPAGSTTHVDAKHGDPGPPPRSTRHSGSNVGAALGAVLGAPVTGRTMAMHPSLRRRSTLGRAHHASTMDWHASLATSPPAHAVAPQGEPGPGAKRIPHALCDGEALGDAVGATLGAAVTGLDVGHIDGAVDVGDELGASVRASPKNRQPSSLVSGKAASQYRSMLRRHADDAASAMQTGS